MIFDQGESFPIQTKEETNFTKIILVEMMAILHEIANCEAPTVVDE